jgi:hypothetical protein
MYTKKVNEGLRTTFIQQMIEVQKNLNKALGIMNNQDNFLEDAPGKEEDNNLVLNTEGRTMEKDALSGQKKGTHK